MNETDPWTRCVRRGDFAAAWRISDAVLRARAGQACFHLPRHQQWVWNGDPLGDKRVLIRCYHGLGDTVQFVRYAPLVRALAKEVTLWAQPALVELLRGVPGVDRVLPLHDGGEVGADYDLDLEIMELPHLFRSTLATIPAVVPYLHVPPGGDAFAPRTPAGGCHVGVVWRAGDWDAARSVPVDGLASSLAAVPGVTLHALQRGPALAEWRAEYGPVSGADDVVGTARWMNALDLVVSVDSFPAHFAGALGRPVWTLLHADPDWRWLEGRNDSPWYPTMRLFRQERPGEWAPVVARVAAELRRNVESGRLPADESCLCPPP